QRGPVPTGGNPPGIRRDDRLPGGTGRRLPTRVDRRRSGRRRLGWLGRAHRAPRGQGPTGRRRPLRDQRGDPGPRHREAGGQRRAGEGEPDRLLVRDPGHHGDGDRGLVRADGFAPFGGDRRRLHRPPRRRHQRRADQDGGSGPVRADRQIQRAAADRGGVGRRRPVRRLGRLPEEAVSRRRLTVVLFSLVLVVVGVAVFTNVIPFGQIRDQQR